MKSLKRWFVWACIRIPTILFVALVVWGFYYYQTVITTSSVQKEVPPEIQQAPPPVVQEKRQEDTFLYTVQKGDTLERIARDHMVLIWQIRATNGMDKSDTLIHPGQTIKIPKIDWTKFSYTGMASWYGPGFHGKKRADGEVYNQNEVLVAHRTFPLGLTLRIKNIENGKTIVASVADRGPYTKDKNGEYKREIDLSLGAAKILGAVENGVIPVKIEPL